MAGIKCLSNILKSTSRVSSQFCYRNLARDVLHSRRKLCSVASVNWNAEGVSSKFLQKSTAVKFYSNSPVTLGCLATINSSSIEISGSCSSDMLDCLGNDDDSDTWSRPK